MALRLPSWLRGWERRDYFTMYAVILSTLTYINNTFIVDPKVQELKLSKRLSFTQYCKATIKGEFSYTMIISNPGKIPAKNAKILLEISPLLKVPEARFFDVFPPQPHSVTFKERKIEITLDHELGFNDSTCIQLNYLSVISPEFFKRELKMADDGTFPKDYPMPWVIAYAYSDQGRAANFGFK